MEIPYGICVFSTGYDTESVIQTPRESGFSHCHNSILVQESMVPLVVLGTPPQAQPGVIEQPDVPQHPQHEADSKEVDTLHSTE